MQVDVCICTFRRDSVGDAIRSVLAQEVDAEVSIRIIVADNDDAPSARERVAALAEAASLPVAYLHCPARNISVARNAALEASEARYLAFLDDDEIADPGWIAALLRRAEETCATVILGPVEARYADGAPRWMRRAAIHDTAPVIVRGEIRTGYTCNVLIDRARPEIRALRFEPALGRTGGEDTAYFTALHRIGGTIASATDAHVREVVTPERASFGWLARRRFRMGQVHARVVLGDTSDGRWRAVTLAAAKLVACGGLALLSIPDAARRNPAILRGCLHAGVISGLVGGRMEQVYGVTGAGAR
ncbi:glycosyltransferase [Rhodobacterales bacterium HKCCE3408]|nr:glycosyltransferase [Rhodobacterales bacterium HKCCE3408]